jgi:PAS domain S-box-containing protein
MNHAAAAAGRQRELPFLAGGGEMGAAMRSHDWAPTPPGCPAAWPQSLRSMVSACLNSPMAGAILWGPDLRVFYNDAFIPLLAERHPGALGRPAAEIWGPTWPQEAASFHRTRETGEGFAQTMQERPISRLGKLETTYWDFTAAPVRGEDGGVAGLLYQASEVSARVRLERGHAEEQERQRSVLQHMPSFVGVTVGPEHVFRYVNDAYSRISGYRPLIGRSVREAFPELEGQGFYRLLDQVYRTGEPFSARSMPIRLAGDDGLHFIDFLYSAVKDADGAALGIFIGGYDVTEWVGAQAALQAERDRLVSVLDGMTEGFSLLDWNFTILDMNGEAMRMETRPRSSIVGHSHWQVYPGTEDSQLGQLYKRAMKDRVPVELQHQYFWEDGRSAWLDMRAYPVPQGLAIFYRDVTSRYEAEAQLRREGERVQLALDSGAVVGTWVWDVPADQLTADARFAATFGIDPDLCRSGVSLAQVLGSIHSDDAPHVLAAIRDALARGGAYRCEYRVRDNGGGYRWIEANGHVELGDDGTPRRFPGVLLNIQSRRDAEAARDAAASLLRTLVAAVPGVVYAKDREGRMLIASDGATELIGKPPEFYIGKTDMEALEDKVQAAVLMETDARIMASGQAEQVEELVNYPDGTRVIWLSNKAPLRNADGEVIGLVGSSMDITARKRAEAALNELNETLEQRIATAVDELRQTEDALRQSQKMEAVGQLTGGIAHDFNNMLAVVIGSLELLERRFGGADARAKRYVDAAMDGARRAALLTRRLLAFSRQQPLRPESTDVNKLVAGMSDLLRHSLGATVEPETVLGGGLWRSFVDPNQLENAILNLAVNARDAMPEGGRLTIDTQNTHLDERYREAHPGLVAGQYVLIAVTDNGSGMPADVIAKAFDPFFTTKEVGRGTGLGLSQVYGFVKQSGGHVKIYSEPGHGTTVKIYLPRYMGDNGAAEEARAVEMPLGEESELILVVEDEPAVRQLSVDALSELGYRVIEADGGKSALHLLERHPDIALMFTDVVMPQMNGARLAQEARSMRPALKIVFTTGYTRNAVVHNGVLDAGVELIGKPFTIEELAAKIRAVLDGG